MEQKRFLEAVLQGNRDAIALCEGLGHISQIWDDLIDEREKPQDQDVNAAFWLALVSVPNNPFYQQHFHVLNPLVQAAIMDWMDANALEQGSEHDKTLAFVLRDSLSSIVSHCARLIGGLEHARAVGPAVRRYFLNESLEGYLAERTPQEEDKDEHRRAEQAQSER